MSDHQAESAGWRITADNRTECNRLLRETRSKHGEEVSESRETRGEKIEQTCCCLCSAALWKTLAGLLTELNVAEEDRPV